MTGSKEWFVSSKQRRCRFSCGIVIYNLVPQPGIHLDLVYQTILYQANMVGLAGSSYSVAQFGMLQLRRIPIYTGKSKRCTLPY